MIARLKQFLASHSQAITPEEQARHLNLAAASLLLEVVFADETLSDEESNLLPSMLAEALSLTSSEAEDLITQATKIQENSTSLYEFTHEINRMYSVEQKQKLILSMWKLAYADGQLCRYEDQIIRRTAELLYLKHSELIQMRNIAMDNRS